MAKLTVTESDFNLRSKITSNLRTSLGITHQGLDSTANIFSEILSNEISNQRQAIVKVFDDMQITNATGRVLDSLAFERYALNRKSSSKAKTFAYERNVMFYIKDGTFGDYNNNNQIVIPQNTRITTQFDSETSDIRYVTTEAVVLPADESFVFVSIESINSGFNSNVSENSLLFHDFTNYVDSYTNALQVTNKFPILNGQDLESDQDFKFRLTNFMTASLNKNNEMIRLAALEAPGVIEVKTVPSMHGIGTVGVVLFNTGRRSNSQLQADVSGFLMELNSPGTNIILSNGIDCYLDFELKIYVDPAINVNEREILKNELTQQIYTLIKDYEYNSVIDLSLVSSYLRNNRNYNQIKGYGSSTESRNLFEKVYLRRTDRYNEFPEEREEIISNVFSLKPYERILFGSVNIDFEEDFR